MSFASASDSVVPLSVCVPFSPSHDFDTRGVLYSLGSAGGASHLWTNPVSLGLVRLASTPLKHDSEAVSCFLSRDSGHRGVLEDSPGNWLLIDFLSVRLCPSHYTLRHFNRQSHALRDWKFQASHDSDDWIDLTIHCEDESLFDPHSSHTWPIPAFTQKIALAGHQGRHDEPFYEREFFRYFRIFMTGPNSSGTSFSLTGSGFEIYGIGYQPVPSPLNEWRKNIGILPPFEDGADERQCVWTGDFDENGALYYIGTGGLRGEWVNPVHSGLVHMTSTPLKVDSDSLDCFIGRTPARGVLADRTNSCFTVDLIAYSVRPTHYSLRHYSSKSSHMLRSWILQGSSDGHNWVNLMEHHNDESLNARNATASWELPPLIDNSPMPFVRFFKILCTGLNSTQYYSNLCCAGFEVWGTMRRNRIEDIPLNAENAEAAGSPDSMPHPLRIPPAEYFSPPREVQSTQVDLADVCESAIIRAPRDFIYHGRDFSEDGVLWWLGTRLSPDDWINPVELNLVSLQSSRMKHDSQPLHVFIGREPTRGVLEDELYGWFCIRFNFHRLALTHYTLRHYVSQRNHMLRCWRMEGSNDGHRWELLRDHNDDESLNGAGSTATFSIAQSSGGKKFYSWFRIMITGTNSTKIYRNLCCSGLEMFGTLEMIHSHGGSEAAADQEEKQNEQVRSPFLSIPSLLDSLQLSQYADRFVVDQITFNSLKLLDDAAMAALIPEAGPRSRLQVWRKTNGFDFHSPDAAIESIQAGIDRARITDDEKSDVQPEASADGSGSVADRPELFAVFEISVQSIIGDGKWSAEKESLINQLKLSFHISESAAKSVLDQLGWSQEKLTEMRKEAEEKNGGGSDDSEGQMIPECLICMSCLCDHVILPCFHLNCCGPCAERVMRNDRPTCPTCRTPIEAIKRVYL